jgi:hypothetical protein
MGALFERISAPHLDSPVPLGDIAVLVHFVSATHHIVVFAIDVHCIVAHPLVIAVEDEVRDIEPIQSFPKIGDAETSGLALSDIATIRPCVNTSFKKLLRA